MNVRIFTHPLNGSLAAPASKSDAHRKLMLAYLSGAETRLKVNGMSDDIRATAACLRALGAYIDEDESGLSIRSGKRTENPLLDAGESGSTLRFLLPAAAVTGSARFTGHGRLPQRPLSHLINAMQANGVCFSGASVPFQMTGKLCAGRFALPGDVSSQYVTALLMALPFLDGDSDILLTTPLQSRDYVILTQRVMCAFSLNVSETEAGYHIPAPQTTRIPACIDAEGDWSNAAFFLTAGAIGTGNVTVTGLDASSAQGDRRIMNLLGEMGASAHVNEDRATVRAGKLKAIRADVSDMPDLAPPLAVAAAFAQGTSVLTGTRRLRLKESDRVEGIVSLICALGGQARAREDEIEIAGGGLCGGSADTRGDHRLAMAAAIAGSVCAKGCTVCGAEAVNKSYPDFFRDFVRLGGHI